VRCRSIFSPPGWSAGLASEPSGATPCNSSKRVGALVSVTAELEVREMLRAARLRLALKPTFAEGLWAVSSRLTLRDDRSYYTLAGPAVLPAQLPIAAL
jgi:hypothetical protein